MPVRVWIVEDDFRLCETLEGMFAGRDDFRCLGVCRSGEEALIRIPAAVPDVVLMDIRLPNMSGIECIAKLRVRVPSLLAIMLTVFEDTAKLFDALQAGASGYLIKSTPTEEILAAIKEVLRGGSPMSTSIARKVVQSFHQMGLSSQVSENLSPREREIVEALAKGYLIKEIADRLQISNETVKTHLKKIYEKLHVRSRAQAVAKHLGQQTGRGMSPAAR